MADRFIGRTALDLTKSDVPADLRAEAYWWVGADGNRGQRIYYVGEKHGIHAWQTDPDTQFYLRSKPRGMDAESEKQLNHWMRRYNERQHEQMVDRDSFVSYSDIPGVTR